VEWLKVKALSTSPVPQKKESTIIDGIFSITPSVTNKRHIIATRLEYRRFK
jgi:hypothetical protein